MSQSHSRPPVFLKLGHCLGQLSGLSGPLFSQVFLLLPLNLESQPSQKNEPFLLAFEVGRSEDFISKGWKKTSAPSLAALAKRRWTFHPSSVDEVVDFDGRRYAKECICKRLTKNTESLKRQLDLFCTSIILIEPIRDNHIYIIKKTY